MKILIVEDDEFKGRRVAEVAQESLKDAEILFSRSVNSGMGALQEEDPDILVLDMSLPTFDVGPNEPGGRPQNFGGLELLRQMERLGISIPTIVITQYTRFFQGSEEIELDVLVDELENDYPKIFSGLIYYNSSQGKWRISLKRMLRYVEKERKRHGSRASFNS